MPISTARTLKGPRRLQRRHDRRSPSPHWQFLRGFLKNPVMVGSIIPSSQILIDKMEVGDPLDEVVSSYTVDGYTYHLQSLAFVYSTPGASVCSREPPGPVLGVSGKSQDSQSSPTAQLDEGSDVG